MTITSNLSGSAKRALRAAAHHLDPVVMIGDKGLTSAVLHEVDIALAAHALIKVRVASDERDTREAFMAEICEKLGCEPVQHLGKLLVLWRNKEGDEGVLDDEAAIEEQAASRSRGPRRKLPAKKDEGFVRPTERDPRPREGRGESPSGGRDGGYARGAARGSDRGEGYAARGSSYRQRDAADDKAAPTSRGYASRGGARDTARDTDGYAPRGAARTTARAVGETEGSEHRRYRRGDDAPAPDTRPPREGWAPRGRRGADRNAASGFERDGAKGFGETRGRGGASAAPRGSGSGTGRGYGDDGFKPRTRPSAGGTAGGGASSGRWGSRGGASGGAPAPKPRARRRLG